MTDNAEKKKRILIIEDEEGLLISLEDRLVNEGYDVATRSDGIRGEHAALTDTWDMIVLDIMLPGKDGFQVCRSLREASVNTPILMLTARDTSIDTVMGLKLGADDYLNKPFDMQVLLARIEALLRRKEMNAATAEEQETSGKLQGRASIRTVEQEIITFGRFTLDTNLKEIRTEGTTVHINAQEYRLLEFLARNPDRVIGRDELLNQVWGYDSIASTRTVDVHIARLRKKLREEESPRHIHTARGHGYRFAL